MPQADPDNDLIIANSAPPVKSTRAGSALRWLAQQELWLLALATPLLLFAGPWFALGWGLILLAWLARGLASGGLTVVTGLEAPIALLAVAGLLGYAVAPDPTHSLAALGRLALGIAWFYGLANRPANAAWLRRLSWLWVAGGAGLLLLVIAGADWQNTRLIPLAIYHRIPQFNLYTRLGVLGNARGMGMALALTAPMLLALALLGRGRALRLAALAVALLMLPVLALTQSLQGAIGLAAGLALLLILWSRWTLLAAIPLAAAALWVAGRMDWHALALTALDINNGAGIAVVLRLDIWSRALAMIRDMPLTGIGLESFPLIQTQFYPGYLLGPEPHAHNLWLQLMLDMGVAGPLGFLWLLAAFAVAVLCALRRRPAANERALLVGAAAGVGAMLGTGIIDSFWAFKLSLLFWLLLGAGVLAARAVQLRQPAAAAGARAWSRRVAIALGLIAALALMLVMRPGVWQTNLGLVRAHQALVASRAAGVADPASLQPARDLLLAAEARAPGNAQVYDTLASLHAWLGEDAASQAALRQRLAMDGRAPMARYAPWIDWRRRLLGEAAPAPADDLRAIYGQWMARYPDRAEGYLRVALVWQWLKGDPARAAAVVQQGLANGAQPDHLLDAALEQLRP